MSTERPPAAAPDVSVVIPTHNRPAFVERAVASCASQPEAAPGLGVELLLVDDGSVPPVAMPATTALAVRALRFDKNRGRNAARNAGLDAAAGRYVQFLDDDDTLEPGALGREVAEADATQADLLICRWRTAELGDTAGPGPIRDRPWTNRGYDSLLDGEAAPTTAVLYRRAYLGELRWDEGLSKLDDWDFFVRTAAQGGRLVASEVVAYTWTSHPGQGVRSSSPLQNAREFYAVLDHLRDELERRGLLTDERRRRLAQYLYKELRFLARYDPRELEARIAEILTLDRDFVPRDEERQAWMRLLCRLIGVRAAMRLYAWGRELATPGVRATAARSIV